MNRNSSLSSQRLAFVLAIVLIAVLFAFAAGIGARPASAAVGDKATITTGVLNVHSGPGPGYPTIAKVIEGDVVTLLGRNSDSSWVEVQLASGAQGWVSTFYIQASTPVSTLPVLAQAQPWGLITAPVLNVRTGPGLDFAVVTTVGQGTFVTVLGRDASSLWIEILVGGAQGWVGRGFIALNVGILDLPVVAAASGSGGGGTAPTATPGGTSAPSGTPVPTGTPAPSVPSAVINTGQLNVRSGPGPGFSIVAQVFEGDKVTLLGRNTTSSWVFVRLASGTQGWISTFYIIANVPLSTLPVMADFIPTGLITAGTANLRAAPSLTGAIITTLNQGTFVSVLGRSADSQWLKVSASGVTGWVGGGVVAVNVPISSLPVAS